MTQRRFHYEQAFEHYLRSNRVPYVAVDEARKSLLPHDAPTPSIKSFDFVVYGPDRNMLIDVKGRMFGSKAAASTITRRRFESWVTQDDVDGLQQWQRLFGDDFQAVFVFMYCLRQQPPDALFEEVLSYNNRWYVLKEISLDTYCREMVERSSRWKTVHVPSEQFNRLSRSFSVRSEQGSGATVAGRR